MFKKYIFILTLLLLSVNFVFADNYILNNMTPGTSNNTILESSSDNWFGILDKILLYIKDKIFVFLMLITIWAFLYVWAKLIVARWNPEEFKKAILSFVYIVVWLFVVSAAWAIVKIVSWINF